MSDGLVPCAPAPGKLDPKRDSRTVKFLILDVSYEEGKQ